MTSFNSTTLSAVPPNAPPDQQIAAINRIIDLLGSFQTAQILKDQRGIPQILIGQDSQTKRNVIKIAEDGVDVTKATDDQLLFNTDAPDEIIVPKQTTINSLELVKQGSFEYDFDLSGPAYGSKTYTNSHGLGYRPIVVAFLNGNRPIPYYNFEVTGGTPAGVVSSVTYTISDTTFNFILTDYLGTVLGTGTIEYYLFKPTSTTIET